MLFITCLSTSELINAIIQIRSKRLAKLASANPPTSAETSSEPSSAALTPQAPEASRPQSGETVAPSTPRLEREGSEGKRIKITPTSAAPAEQRSQSGTVTPVSNTPPPSKQEDTLEAFEDRTLSAVFKLTLDESRQRDIHGQRLTFLSGLRSELEDQNLSLRISTAVLDQALLEAASSQPDGKPLDYLLPCWKRVTRLHKGFRKARNNDPKFEVICEARRLCMSYAVFALTMPEMFG